MEQIGKPDISPTGLTAGAAPESLDMSVIGVVDQLLIGLTDKVLNAETAIRDNTAQVKMMANSVELARGIPGKMDAVEKQLAAVESQTVNLKQLDGAVYAKLQALEAAIMKSLDEPRLVEASIAGLRHDLDGHARTLREMLTSKFRVQHNLAWTAWFPLVASVLACVFAALWMYASSQNREYKADNIVLRGIKLVEDSVFMNIVQGEELQYREAPQHYLDSVIGEEQRRAALTERLLEINKDSQEIDELKRRGKKD